MQLNVLDDLAEAMKALDGKKQSRYICHHSGRKGGLQEQPGGRAVPIRRLGGFVGKPISYQGLSANTRLERTDDSKKGDMETDPIQPLGRKPANDPTRRVETTNRLETRTCRFRMRKPKSQTGYSPDRGKGMLRRVSCEVHEQF